MRRLAIATILALPLCAQRQPGSQLDHLPPNMEVLTHFGERADISPDNREVAFMAKSFDDAIAIDLKTRTIRCLTCNVRGPRDRGRDHAGGFVGGDAAGRAAGARGFLGVSTIPPVAGAAFTASSPNPKSGVHNDFPQQHQLLTPSAAGRCVTLIFRKRPVRCGYGIGFVPSRL
jgi:hypothetical protein